MPCFACWKLFWTLLASARRTTNTVIRIWSNLNIARPTTSFFLHSPVFFISSYPAAPSVISLHLVLNTCVFPLYSFSHMSFLLFYLFSTTLFAFFWLICIISAFNLQHSIPPIYSIFSLMLCTVLVDKTWSELITLLALIYNHHPNAFLICSTL